MDEAQIQRIMNHPEFQSMAKKKTSLGLIFTIITLVFWFGYLLLEDLTQACLLNQFPQVR